MMIPPWYGNMAPIYRGSISDRSFHVNRFGSNSTKSRTLTLERRPILNRIQHRSLTTNSHPSTLPPTNSKKLIAKKLENIPTLAQFMMMTNEDLPNLNPSPSPPSHWPIDGGSRRVLVETYGCQMNVSDSQIIHGILGRAGFSRASSLEDADIVLLNTCAIRDHAEQRIWSRLGELRSWRSSRSNKLLGTSTFDHAEISWKPSRVIGILGCMAERLKSKILDREKLVDLVVGPDAYRDLPLLLSRAETGEKVIQVILSSEETYADLAPVRIGPDRLSAFVSIGRGCNQHCTYCIVPRVRGVERSRSASSIESEIRSLSASGCKEVTLLGQNVNSYNDWSELEGDLKHQPSVEIVSGFKTVYRTPRAGITFAQLLSRLSDVDPEMRIRFTSPHPKDFPDSVLEVIASRPNICKSLHIPAQSGSSTVLERMRRGYNRESYLALVDRIHQILGPDTSLSSDFIAGFCGETEEDHADTLSLIQQVEYDQAFLFAYSMREQTPAHRRYEDDVPLATKQRRLSELIEAFHLGVHRRNSRQIGKQTLVLIEKTSKRSQEKWMGRNDGNKKVILEKVVNELPICHLSSDGKPVLVWEKKPILSLPSEMSGQDGVDNENNRNEGSGEGSEPYDEPGDSRDDKKAKWAGNRDRERYVQPGEYIIAEIIGTTGLSFTGKAIAKTTLTVFHKLQKSGYKIPSGQPLAHKN